MTSTCTLDIAWERILIAGLLLLPILSACGRPGGAVSSDVPVSVHAVNYSDEEFRYTLKDPQNQLNSGGGEAITGNDGIRS